MKLKLSCLISCDLLTLLKAGGKAWDNKLCMQFCGIISCGIITEGGGRGERGMYLGDYGERMVVITSILKKIIIMQIKSYHKGVSKLEFGKQAKSWSLIKRSWEQSIPINKK